MKLYNQIRRKLTKITNIQKDVEDSEDKFYTQLFTLNPSWNTTHPNYEEKLRWDIVEKFIYYIKGTVHEGNKGLLKILDLGCGRGWMTNLLSNHGTIIGVEPVTNVVAYANKIFPNLTIYQATSKELLSSSKHGQFDLIVSSEVIEHIPDSLKHDFINDIKLLLAEKGFCIITTPRKEAEPEWKKYSHPGQPIEDWLTESELKAFFLSAGFSQTLQERLAIRPTDKAPLIEIYQLWLFQK